MKGTSVYSREITMPAKKLFPLWSKLKTLSLSEFLTCIFAGIISQGTLFGILKPFSVAIYAAFSGSIKVKALMTIFIFIWNIARGDLFTALKQTAVIFLYEWLKRIMLHNEKETDSIKDSLFLGSAAAITGIFIFIINGQSMESFLIVIMEVVLAIILTMIFSVTIHGRPISTDNNSVSYKNVEYFGMLLMGGAFLLGITGIGFAGLHVDRILAGLCLLMLTRHFGPGFGACAGCMTGMALSANFPDSFIAFAGIYAVSGMAAGMLHKSKTAAGCIFFVTQFLFLLLSENLPISWLDAIIPVILFLVIPDLRTGRIIPIKNRIECTKNESEKTNRICNIVSERICDMSRAFYKLGHTLEDQIKDSDDKKETYGIIIEHLTQKVCSSCNKSVTCWEKRLLYTYSVMCNLVDSLQADQTDLIGDAEKELNRFCVKPALTIDTLTRVIEIKRVDKVWQRIVYESRSVIPEQIYSISEILTKLSGEVFNNIEYFGEEEKSIEDLIRKSNFPIIKAEVKRAENQRFITFIQFDGCKGQKMCTKVIENAVTKVLGVNMLTEDGDCKNRGRDSCLMCLKEKEKLGVITGVARTKKNGASVSGDSFSFLKTNEGKYVVTISDGMGSGSEANKLSEAAVGLFEQLLDCGVSIRLSLNLVDMIIAVKNSEKYATMDLAAIDLHTGETEFYKMGAIPSLVINEKGIDYIQINSLPAGLHRGNSVHSERRKLGDGDFIIMMTDGVYDRLSEGQSDKFLERVINTKNTLNPQEMADNLLKKACAETENIGDDMTVLVAKVWHKTG